MNGPSPVSDPDLEVRRLRDAVPPMREYFTLKIVVLLAGLSVGCAALFGVIAASAGHHPIVGALVGIPVCIPAAAVLFILQKREYARIAKASQKIGWSYQEAETKRRLSAVKAQAQ